MNNVGTTNAFEELMENLFLRPEQREEFRKLGQGVKRTQWWNCYSDSWQGIIVPRAFVHPAKAARGLLGKIFDHLFEEGWLKREDTVLDLFGGVGTTGIVASSRGCRSVLLELESHFCLLAEESFRIHDKAWQRLGLPRPIIIQGDSRHLLEILKGQQAQVILTSPPYADCPGTPSLGSVNKDNWGKEGRDIVGRRGLVRGYSAPTAVITSPPYADGCARTGGADPHPERIRGGKIGHVLENYSTIVTSPPFGSSEQSRDGDFTLQSTKANPTPRSLASRNYFPASMSTEGQIGNQSTSDYWSSCAEIYRQCFALLPGHGHMVIVLKSYIRQGRIVDLPSQTADLLQSIGFRLLHVHEAMLIARESQLTLDGGETRKGRKSFFRRLYEKKHPELSIDAEIVLCLEKPKRNRA